MEARRRRIAILGAGPTGLEAALAAAARGHDFRVYEAAPRVAAHVRAWGHVEVFTPWDLNVSPRARAALGERAPSGDALPTGDELAERLYEPLAASEPIRSRLRTGTRVRAVSRDGLLKSDEIGTGRRGERPFRLLLDEHEGAERIERADAVLDCTGTYGNPNALGDGGIPAPGEGAAAGAIERRLTSFAAEPERWAGRTILLTGAGHSAQTAAAELARFARDAPGTEVLWAVRSPAPDWGAVAGDPLPARRRLNGAAAELAAGASPHVRLIRGAVCEALAPRDGRVAVALRNGAAGEVVADRVLALNGSVGDPSIYRQLQVHECYATAGPMKLAASLLAAAGADALTNPEPGFFILGAKSYGRNPQFLLRVGWQQVDDVFSLL